MPHMMISMKSSLFCDKSGEKAIPRGKYGDKN